MDASCWNNSCNSLFTVDITQEFIKSLIRVAHLITVFILYIAEDDQLIIPCSSISANRNTHARIYTQKKSELFLEGENYPWHGMDWCKHSSYFHSACSLTVGLKRALNKPLFHILVAFFLKSLLEEGWNKSEVETNLINKESKYSKWISLQSKQWEAFYWLIILYTGFQAPPKVFSSNVDYLT